MGAGTDSLVGGTENDLYIISAATVKVTEGAGAGTDTVSVSGLDLSAFTSLTNVEMVAVDGNVTLTGSQADALASIVGGAGSDAVYLTSAGDLSTTTISSVERLDVNGSTTMTGTQADAFTTIVGHGASDVVYLTSAFTGAVGADFSHIESIIGTTGNDTLVSSNTNAVYLDGGAGTNSLVGGAGYGDTLVGGSGDVLAGGAGNDLYIISATPTSIVEATDGTGGTSDTIRATGSMDLTALGAGLANLDVLDIGANQVTLTGTQAAYFDSIFGAAGSDLYVNGSADLHLKGISGVVRLDIAGSVSLTGTQADAFTSIVGNGASDVVYLTDSFGGAVGADFSGVDSIIGSAGNDTLVSSNLNNVYLNGGAGTNSLVGGAGYDDTLVGSGSDVLAGGAGNDLYIISASTVTVTEGGSAGSDTVSVSGLNLSTFSSLANVEFLAESGNVSLTGAQAIALTSVVGTSSSDAVYLTASVASAVGGNFSSVDSIIGSTGDDTLVSSNTNAVYLDGGAGTDSLVGGAGYGDTLVGSGSDVLAGGDGNDLYIITSSGVNGVTLTEGVGAGSDTVSVSGLDLHSTTLTNIEYLKVSGSVSLTGAQADGLTSIVGTSSSDAVYLTDSVASAVGGNLSSVESLFGSAGDDVLTAANAHYVDGRDGNDSLLGSSSNDTLVGGIGDDTITAGAGNDSINTGDGTNVVQFLSTDFTLADTVVGGANTDTIRITDNATVVDADFTKVTAVETLLLAGTSAQSVTFDGTIATAAGIRTVDATAGTASTINVSGTSAGLTVSTNAGNDVIISGAGSDIISSGAGNDTITAGAGNDSINTGDGTNVVQFLSTDFTLADTVVGGANTDTIRITNNATVVDANFTHVSLVETLLLAGSGAQTVTLSSLSDAAGISTVDATASAVASTIDFSGTHTLSGGLGLYVLGGSVNDTITGGGGNDTITGNVGADSLDGGAGNDVFIYASATELSGDATVIGGVDSDTIRITGNSATVVDADFTKVTSVETLLLAGTGVQSVTFSGTIATTAGIRTVNATASNSASTIDISGTTVGLHVLAGDGSDTITAGSGSDNISSGNGSNVVKFLNANFDLNDTVSGGNGTDTISITDDATVVDADFTKVTSVQTLLLAGTGVQNVTLGALSNTAAIRTVDATASINDSTIDVSGNNADLTVRTGSGNDTIKGGGGNDTITSGAGNDSIDAGANDDVIQFASANFDELDTVAGGGGSNTIRITDTATVVDLDFTNVSSVQTLVLASSVTGAQSATLSTYANTAGIRTVDATGNGNATIDVHLISANMTVSTSDGADTIISGAGNDTITSGSGNDSINAGDGANVVQFTSGNFDLHDTVVGGANTDTIRITGSNVTVIDSDFTNVINVETLLLTGNGAQQVTLGGAANTAGIRTVDASASNNGSTINISGTSAGLTVSTGNGDDTITAGSGNDSINAGSGANFFQFTSGNFTLDDTVVGGANTDTIRITDTATVVDADFTHVSSVQTLVLAGSGAQSVTLSFRADAAGILTVDATAGTASTIDVSGTSAGLTVSTGSGNDTITGGSGNDTITGGAGADVMNGGTGDNTFVFHASDVASGETVTFSGTSDTFHVATSTDFSLLNGGAALTGLDVINLASSTTATFTGAQLSGLALTVNGVAGGATESLVVNAGAGTTVTLANMTVTNAAVTLNGSTGDENLTGTAGADVISGGTGNDTITAGSGNDSINAGDGANFVQFTFANFDLNDTVVGGANTDTIRITDNATVVNADFTHVTFVETLLLAGTGAQSVTLGALSDSAGIHTVDATAGLSNSTINISGTSAGLTVSTGSGNDTITGGTGSGGHDSLVGGAGNDLYIISDAAAHVTDASGTDTLQLGVDMSISGFSGLEVLDIGSHTISMTSDQALAFSDIVGTGHVSIDGVDYNLATLNLGGDVLSLAGAGALWGFAGNDSLTGSAGADLLVGGAGNDSLVGDAGSDVLIGGAGADTLTGGLDADVFKYMAVSEFGDIILDYGNGGNDVIDVKNAADLGGLSYQYGVKTGSDFGTSNIFIFSGASGAEVNIDTVAAQIAADSSVNATKGLIVLQSSTTHNVEVWYCADMQNNGAETLIATLVGVNITTQLFTFA